MASKIKVKVMGDFSVTKDAVYRMASNKHIDRDELNRLAKKGVIALASATPKDTGRTASSWGYKIKEDKSRKTISVVWTNSNKTEWGDPVAILLFYGHGTRNGGYVQGLDYINPALKEVFDDIIDGVWEEVTR